MEDDIMFDDMAFGMTMAMGAAEPRAFAMAANIAPMANFAMAEEAAGAPMMAIAEMDVAPAAAAGARIA